MSAQPPFVAKRPEHNYPDYPARHDDRVHLPPIPDLRFEYSYLRSIQRFITLRRASVNSHTSGVGDGKKPLSTTKEIVDVQWSKVIWITTRDQIISPLLQGALWAIASYFLSPVAANFGSKVGGYTRSAFSTTEGSVVTWLRVWASSLGFGASNRTNNSRT